MSCLSLGVERMLKEYIVYLLDDTQRPSSATRCQNGNMKSFESFERTVLSSLSVCLERCSGRAPGYGLKVDFYKFENSDHLFRLFS